MHRGRSTTGQRLCRHPLPAIGHINSALGQARWRHVEAVGNQACRLRRFDNGQQGQGLLKLRQPLKLHRCQQRTCLVAVRVVSGLRLLTQSRQCGCVSSAFRRPPGPTCGLAHQHLQRQIAGTPGFFKCLKLRRRQHQELMGSAPRHGVCAGWAISCQCTQRCARRQEHQPRFDGSRHARMLRACRSKRHLAAPHRSLDGPDSRAGRTTRQRS
jgi:hypothetical protein